NVVFEDGNTTFSRPSAIFTVMLASLTCYDEEKRRHKERLLRRMRLDEEESCQKHCIGHDVCPQSWGPIILVSTRRTSWYRESVGGRRHETKKDRYQRFSGTPGKSCFGSHSRKRRLSGRWRACPLPEA